MSWTGAVLVAVLALELGAGCSREPRPDYVATAFLVRYGPDNGAFSDKRTTGQCVLNTPPLGNPDAPRDVKGRDPGRLWLDCKVKRDETIRSGETGWEIAFVSGYVAK